MHRYLIRHIAGRDVHATLDYYYDGSAMSGERHIAVSETHDGNVRHADALSRCETPELDARRRESERIVARMMATYFAARRSSMPSQPPRLAPAV